MVLVDYSSDSEPDQKPETGHINPALSADSTVKLDKKATSSPVRKRRKLSGAKTSEASSALPPLPVAFHDLYASTVRVSTSDDPALHQGRKRVNPHRAGSWPTHLYIEWHPTATERELLASLLEGTQSSVPPSTEILSFLNSDLGAPQPLHISLSRPIVLSTAQKDEFLERLVADLGGSSVRPFDLAPRALAWHRTHESARSFLVLRVASAAPAVAVTAGDDPETANSRSGSSNPELTELLRRCNKLVESHGQPPLYAPRTSRADGNTPSAPDNAFHISVAWSFADVDESLRERTEEAFVADPALRRSVLAMRVRVDGIKAKIGNIVTHVALPARGSGGSSGKDV